MPTGAAALPLVSVITPCLNRAAFLEQAILSLRAQDYPAIEHIVADGGSTDGTLEILRRYQDRLHWFSEPDRGQADALNKALARTHGEIIGWLNSDDVYLPGAIATAVDAFQRHPDVDLIYGGCVYIDAGGNTIGRHPLKPFDVRRLIWYEPGSFAIQSTFFRRRVFESVGGFDLGLRFALDYDWMIRVGKRHCVRAISQDLGAFRRHEEATQGRHFRSAYHRETVLVSRRHGGLWFTPVKANVYYLLNSLPVAAPAAVVLRFIKRILVSLRLAPEWL